MTEESRTDFSSNQSRKPFFSPAYATKRFIAIFRQSRLQTVSPGLSARALVSPKKKPQSNPHPNFSTKFDGSGLAKIQQTRQRNPSHPSSSERSIGRTIRSIERFDRVASRRSLTVDDVERIASRSPRLTTRTSVAPKRHGPSVTDRSIDRPMVVPRSSFPLAVPTRTTARRIGPFASRKRTLPAGFLAETFLVPPRWVFAAATMTRVVLTASICSGSGSRGSFVRVK